MRANTPADHRAAAAPRRCARLYIDRLTHQLALFGGRACIRHDRKEIAAEEFLSSIYRYARALTALGIQRGQIVALFAPNRPDALAIRYAANLIGAGATFLSTPHTPEARITTA